LFLFIEYLNIYLIHIFKYIIKMKTILLSLLSFLTLSYAYDYSHYTEIDPRYKVVTCSSTIKLQNVMSGAKLHSHSVRYGSGSGEQSVTGFNENDDSNSYWMVTGKFGKDCERGKKNQM